MFTEEQHKVRKNGIGASECATVMGLNPFMSPYELWREKKEIDPPQDLSNNDLVVFGNILEEPVLKIYEYLTKKKAQRNQPQISVYHIDYPYMFCTPDATIIEEKRLIEAKTANPYSKDWGEPGTDQIPIKYMCQVQYQLFVLGWEDADLIVFRATTDVRIYYIKRNEVIIAEIIKRVKNFWVNHVLANRPPEMITLKDAEYFFPRSNSNYLDVDNIALQDFKDIVNVKKQINKLKDQEEAIKLKLIKIVGENEGLRYGEETLLSWKPNKNGKRVLRINDRETL